MTKKNFILLFVIIATFCSFTGRSMEPSDDATAAKLKLYFDNPSMFNQEEKDALSKMVTFHHIDIIFPFEREVDEKKLLLIGAWFFRKSANENSRTLVIMDRRSQILRVRIVYDGKKYIQGNKSYATLIDLLTVLEGKIFNLSQYISPKQTDPLYNSQNLPQGSEEDSCSEELEDHSSSENDDPSEQANEALRHLNKKLLIKGIIKEMQTPQYINKIQGNRKRPPKRKRV